MPSTHNTGLKRSGTSAAAAADGETLSSNVESSLFREVGFLSSAFLVVGNIIGIGIFTTSGLIAARVGSSIWIIGVWLIGGCLALIGAVCYARLGVLFPRAGGEYAFLYPTYGSLAAFLSGWASLFIGFTAPIAASALGLAHYLSPYLPPQMAGEPVWIKGIAIVTLVLVSFFLSLGLKVGNSLHAIVTLLNFFLAIGFSLLVLYRAPVSTNLTPILTSGFGGASLPDLASAVVLVMFTYSGWNAAAYLAEEIKTPEKNIPGALVGGTVAVIVLYVLINLAYFSAAPLVEISGEVAVAEVTARAVFGPLGQNLVNVLILFSILSSLTAMSIAGPRVYYAMARDGLFPTWLSEVDATRKVPLRSIWFQSLVASFFILVGTFYEILLYSGFILILFSTLTVSSLFLTTTSRLLPAIFIFINSLILVNAAISNPWITLIGLATVGAGIPVYLYFHRRRILESRRE